jgi:large repetitive protein
MLATLSSLGARRSYSRPIVGRALACLLVPLVFAPEAVAQTQAFPSSGSLRLGSNPGSMQTGSCDYNTNLPPVANPGPNRTVQARTVVVFDGTGSYDPDGRAIDTHTWYFGDGGFSRDAVAEHVYTTPGVYMVRLTVTDVCGAVGRKDIFVNVTPGDDGSPCDGNVPPVADAGPDQTVDAGVTVYFGGSDDAADATHEWNFGDGTTAAGRYVEHVFANAGLYTVTLTVTDDCGDSSVDQMTVTVNEPDPCEGNLAPTANAGGNRALQTGASTFFYGQGSDLDGYINPTTGYHWNFGDGTTSNQRYVQKALLEPGCLHGYVDGDGRLRSDRFAFDYGDGDGP